MVILAAVILLTVAYRALVFYDNRFAHGRMRETPAVKPHETPLLLMEAGVVPFSGGEALWRAADGRELRSPLDPGDPEVIRRGEQQYATYCAQCHGVRHDGNGTVGQSFAPLPRDLRDPAVQSMPAGKLFKEISYGIPGGRQPPLATTIAAEDRWRIVAYVQSLGHR
jgi:mono/diheme cytochrome c family protein